MGKYTIIILVGFVFSLGFVKKQLERTSVEFVQNLVTEYEQSEAKTVAYSLANMSLAALDDNLDWRTGYAGVSMGGGMGWTMVQDSGTDASLIENQVRVIASGKSGSMGYMVNAKAFLPFDPKGLRAAVTANSDVTTLGSLVVDGRDHDMDGILQLGSGTLAVSTTQELFQSGASLGGGTSDIDYKPAKPAHPSIIEEYYHDFPDSPDDVFGFPEGWLKMVAMRGKRGSQYVTDPTQLTYPLAGVTYVELPDGGLWEAINFTEDSWGVLVVHNSAGNAKMMNLNDGAFKGVIIADDIEHIHALILGGVVSMTETPSENCIGNGTGDVLFSRESVRRASSAAAGGDGGITILSWDGSVIVSSGQDVGMGAL